MTLSNYNGPMRAFVPGLMGGTAEAPNTPLRDCHVVDGVLSTFVIPGDWQDDIAKWRNSDTHFKFRGPRIGAEVSSPYNQVCYYCSTDPTRGVALQYGGADTFKAMKEAFATATGPGHFIVLLGWSLDLDFALEGKGTLTSGVMGNTARDIFVEKVVRGVMLRGLFWRVGGKLATQLDDDANDALDKLEKWTTGVSFGGHPIQIPSQNGPEIEFINSLNPAGSSPKGALAVWDDDLRDPRGAHHQKILVVYGNQGLIAFFGGVDISATRVLVATDDKGSPKQDGSPLQDVHCRVQGDAAGDILELCIARWNACSRAKHEENATMWRSLVKDPGTLPPQGRGSPRQEVQIGHTRGNPAMPFASDGWGMLTQCIHQARKFIHMEDQYFWSEPVAEELNKALPHIEHLTIVLTQSSIFDVGLAGVILRRRATRKLLAGLSDTDRNKVGIYSPTKAGDPGTYVHSKVWIFDDECAIVGSSNCNNRGYKNDSEMMGRVSEGTHRQLDDLDLNFAHKLRMSLWHYHMGGRKPMESLYDPASVFYFRYATPSTLRVSIEGDNTGPSGAFRPWDDFTNYDEGQVFQRWKGEALKSMGNKGVVIRWLLTDTVISQLGSPDTLKEIFDPAAPP
jgi:phosphatidylserine/phosphatidylglycerophosphate/cardiolipin synthase-like enzyme